MKLTLIQPRMGCEGATDAMQPLALGILAAQTPPDVEVTLVDERVGDQLLFDDPTDLVALTVETFTAKRAYQIASRFRARGVPVVMGGFHPSLMTGEALRFADSVVIGDAEGIWAGVIEDVRRGVLQRLYRQQSPPPLEGMWVDRTIFAEKSYAPIGLVQYGRGCRYACDFCSIRAFYHSHIRLRPVPEVVAEIASLERKIVFFVDDNLLSDPKAAEKLFRALIPLNIRWACQVSIDITSYPKLLDLMAESGCILALMGFESLDEHNLRQMKKGWNLKIGDYEAAIKRLYERGIMIYGTFVFGYDHDTSDAFSGSLEFAKRHKFCLANFNPLTPTPGTDLYRRLAAEKRLIFDSWWLDDRFRYGQATFHPRGMTAEELEQGCYWARCEFNRATSILGRFLDLKSNLSSLASAYTYIVANLISKREIARKQGLRLGDGSRLGRLEEV